MPKKIPTSQLTRKKCKDRDWEIIGGEVYVTTHFSMDVVNAAKAERPTAIKGKQSSFESDRDKRFSDWWETSADPLMTGTERIAFFAGSEHTTFDAALRALRANRPGFYKDIGGFIDLLCVGDALKIDDDCYIPCEGIIGIQTTSRSGMSARKKKMRTECLDNVVKWLTAGGILYLHGWDQPGGPGKRYRLKEEQVILDGDGLVFIDADEPKF